jgi:hypothetical protein
LTAKLLIIREKAEKIVNKLKENVMEFSELKKSEISLINQNKLNESKALKTNDYLENNILKFPQL